MRPTSDGHYSCAHPLEVFADQSDLHAIDPTFSCAHGRSQLSSDQSYRNVAQYARYIDFALGADGFCFVVDRASNEYSATLIGCGDSFDVLIRQCYSGPTIEAIFHGCAEVLGDRNGEDRMVIPACSETPSGPADSNVHGKIGESSGNSKSSEAGKIPPRLCHPHLNNQLTNFLAIFAICEIPTSTCSD